MSSSPIIPYGPAWFEMLREIAQRTGQAVRAGAGDSIEFQSINTGQFMPVQLPEGGTAFPSTRERDDALQVVQTP